MIYVVINAKPERWQQGMYENGDILHKLNAGNALHARFKNKKNGIETTLYLSEVATIPYEMENESFETIKLYLAL